MYEQICISPILGSINNLSHCQETARGYRLPEEYVSHKAAQAQTMLIFGKNYILDLAQKSQISFTVAAEILVKLVFYEAGNSVKYILI